jgi:hypothetical protein
VDWWIDGEEKGAKLGRGQLVPASKQAHADVCTKNLKTGPGFSFTIGLGDIS